MEPWWVRVLSVLAGVLVGFVLSQGADMLKSRKRRKAHRGALRSEMELCRKLSTTFVADNKLAPLYRLPTLAYEKALPSLIADAAIEAEKLGVITEFFNEVATLNRGLDRAGAAPSQQVLIEEHNRNQVKAKNLLENLYPRARDALQ